MTASLPPILLIEDTPSLQLLYRAALTKAGYAVVTAGTAGEGLVEQCVICCLEQGMPLRSELVCGSRLIHQMPEGLQWCH